MTKKQVISLLHKRAKLAKELLDVSAKIDRYIEEHHLEDKIENEDWLLGVEILGCPNASAERVIEIIEKEVLL